MSKKKTFKIFVIIGGLISFAVVVFLVWQNFGESKKLDDILIDDHLFRVETVVDEKSKELGLGKRRSLCQDCGMLFVFDRPGKYAFWMKRMRFGLDILWINEGRIVFIEKNIPPAFGQTMTPPENADQVLELNAGTVERFGIKVGDRVESERMSNFRF